MTTRAPSPSIPPTPRAELPSERRAPSDGVPGASLARGLRCAACGAEQGLDAATACSSCFGPLHVSYDLRDGIGHAPEKFLGGRAGGIWRFQKLLPPVSSGLTQELDIGPSPLRKARRLGEAWGLSDLWLKDDTVLPSGSFKDRPASVAVAFARDRGFREVGCASTGNLAAATARAAARVGLPCSVFVPAGLPETKLLPVQVLGGRIVEVEGSYDDANRVANLLGEQGSIGLVNITLRPYYTEGSKTLGLETLEALGWRSPDWVGVPLGSGALLSATFRGLEQVRELGWLDRSERDGPAIFGSQPIGCSPIADAFGRADGKIVPVQEPRTIAESLAIGDPASGYEALAAIRATGGFADAPTPEEVLSAIHDAARHEGVWTEPAGGTVLASIRSRLDDGTIERGDRVVAFLTGAGWKTTKVLQPVARWAPPSIRISPQARNLRSLLSSGPPEAVGAAAGLRSPPRPEVGPW
jgi:threonine synthase